MRQKYQNVSLPLELIEEIQIAISERGHGYVSVSEFVKDACRRRIEEVG